MSGNIKKLYFFNNKIKQTKSKIYDKDKLIIIYYIGFKTSVPQTDICNKVNEIYYNLKNIFDDSVVLLVVPSIGGETRIDYINKEKCNDDKIKKLENSLNDYKRLFGKSFNY